MSESVAVPRPAPRSGAQRRREQRRREQSRREQSRFAALASRRNLQLVLGVIWVLDGILQYQPWMFSKGFPGMLAGGAQGNPAVIAQPITWSAAFVGHHLAVLNALFATGQLALGLGIAWRPTVKLALAGSIVWSLAVWWLGEGLGGILAGTASPVSGAPGAVILYAILAVLLWPADRDPAAPYVAARSWGRRTAQAIWLVVWGSLAAFAVLPATRAPGAISGMISDASGGAPPWLAWIDNQAASALKPQGLAPAIALAVLLALIAVAVFLPARFLRAAVIAALAVSLALWLAQGLGEIFTGMATDPNSGPLLALIAMTYSSKREA